MPKRKKPSGGVPITCGKCMQGVDEAALFAALRKGTGYTHECGKRLVKGSR